MEEKRTRRSLILFLSMIVALIAIATALNRWVQTATSVHSSTVLEQVKVALWNDDLLNRFKTECNAEVLPPDVTSKWSKCLGISTEDNVVSALNFLGGDILRISNPGSYSYTTISSLTGFIIVFPDDPRWNDALVAFLTQERFIN